MRITRNGIVPISGLHAFDDRKLPVAKEPYISFILRYY